jgi:hypothetical protein
MPDEKKTLLQIRREQLDDLIEDLLTRTDTLRRCRDGKYHDLTERVRDVEEIAFKARLIAAKVDDLNDIEAFGSSGGRY